MASKKDRYTKTVANHSGRCMRCGKELHKGQEYYRAEKYEESMDPTTWDWHCLQCHDELTENERKNGGWKPIQREI